MAAVHRALPDDLTLSTMRAPLSTPLAPSLSTSLPALDFNFDALRSRMTEFTARFDTFISTSRASLLEARSAHRLALSHAAEESASLSRQVATQEAKRGEHAQSLAQQQQEAGEMKGKIRELEGVRDERRAGVDALHERLEGVRARLAGKRAGVRQREMYAGVMRGHNAEELEAWEAALGLRIEGTGDEERVRFLFDVPGIAGVGEARCVSFELDMSGLAGTGSKSEGRGYEVVECAPRVDAQQVEKIVERMCETEELGKFLGEMRGLLLETLR